MKYKTFCRICLRLVGVYFAVNGFGELVTSVVYYVNAIIQAAQMFTTMWLVAQATGGAVQTVVGLYLFFGGKWVVDCIIPSNRPYCHECGYDLTGAKSQQCPECRTPFAERPQDAAVAGPMTARPSPGGPPLRDENRDQAGE